MVVDKRWQPYVGDMRGVLKSYAVAQFKKNGCTLNAANEIEGFHFCGLRRAERHFHETGKFEYVKHRRVLSLLPGRFPARACLSDHSARRCTARYGLPERKGSPRGGSFSIRN